MKRCLRALRAVLSIVAALVLILPVGAPAAFAVATDSVQMTYPTASVQIAWSVQLAASALPAGASQVFSWSSSNTAVATVDGSGKVTGLAPGTVQIRATATDGSGRYGETTVTVTGSAVTGVRVNLASRELSLDVGRSYTLDATVYPSDASGTAYSWSVADTSVASYQLGNNGRSITLYGQRVGTTTLQVYCNGYTDSIPVRVNAPYTSATNYTPYYSNNNTTPYGAYDPYASSYSSSSYSAYNAISSMTISTAYGVYAGTISRTGSAGSVVFNVPSGVDLSNVGFSVAVPQGALVLPGASGWMSLRTPVTFTVIGSNNAVATYSVYAAGAFSGAASGGATSGDTPYGALIDPDTAGGSGETTFGYKRYVVQVDGVARFQRPSQSSTRLSGGLTRGSVLRVVRLVNGFAECLSSDGPTFFVVNNASYIRAQ